METMTESTDLIRRLDTAIASKSLHPNYARGLLREAREALDNRRAYVVRPVSAPPVILDFPWDEDEESCEVCHGQSGGAFSGVECSSLGAFSIAYCHCCLGNNAEPYGILAALISESGGIEGCADWVRDLTTWCNGAYVPAADLPSLQLEETAADEPT